MSAAFCAGVGIVDLVGIVQFGGNLEAAQFFHAGILFVVAG